MSYISALHLLTRVTFAIFHDILVSTARSGVRENVIHDFPQQPVVPLLDVRRRLQRLHKPGEISKDAFNPGGEEKNAESGLSAGSPARSNTSPRSTYLPHVLL